MCYRNVSDENPPHDDFDSKISEDIAEKLIANAIIDKEKSSTENNQQDSSTRKLTDRDIIKAIKRKQTENTLKFKKDGGKEETTSTMKRYYDWFNNGHRWRSYSNRMKRGRNSVFGNDLTRDIMSNPQKRQVNSATEAASLDIKGVMKPCRLSDEEATRAVAVHRAYRKKESANNMWTMVNT